MLGRESARAASTGWFQSEVFWVVGMLMGGSGAEETLSEMLSETLSEMPSETLPTSQNLSGLLPLFLLHLRISPHLLCS